MRISCRRNGTLPNQRVFLSGLAEDTVIGASLTAAWLSSSGESFTKVHHDRGYDRDDLNKLIGNQSDLTLMRGDTPSPYQPPPLPIRTKNFGKPIYKLHKFSTYFVLTSFRFQVVFTCGSLKVL